MTGMASPYPGGWWGEQAVASRTQSRWKPVSLQRIYWIIIKGVRICCYRYYRNCRVIKETKSWFEVYHIYLSVSVKSRTNSALALFFHIENVTFWVSIVFLSVLNTWTLSIVDCYNFFRSRIAAPIQTSAEGVETSLRSTSAERNRLFLLLQ